MSDQNQKSDLIPLCGLWKNKTKDGKDFFTGNFTYGSRIIIFENNFKRNEKDPTHQLYIAKQQPRDQQQQQTAAPQSPQQDIAYQETPVKYRDEMDDVPF